MAPEPAVYVVDDDEAVRTGLRWLFSSVGIAVEGYHRGGLLLEQYVHGRPACAFVDVRMPDMSGLDLLDRIVAADLPLPVIMLSGHGDIPMALAAIRKGALDFIPKPGHEQHILDQAQRALKASARCIDYRVGRADAQRAIAELSARELEVMRLAAAGNLNKEIAESLSISERTVESHRLSGHRKLQLRAGAELSRVMHLYVDAQFGHCRGAMGAWCPRCRAATWQSETSRVEPHDPGVHL